MHQKKSFWYLTFMQYKWAKYFIPHLDHLNFNTMQLLFIFYIEICRNYKLYLYSDIFIFFVLTIYIIYGTQYFLNKWWHSHEGINALKENAVTSQLWIFSIPILSYICFFFTCESYDILQSKQTNFAFGKKRIASHLTN